MFRSVGFSQDGLCSMFGNLQMEECIDFSSTVNSQEGQKIVDA